MKTVKTTLAALLLLFNVTTVYAQADLGESGEGGVNLGLGEYASDGYDEGDLAGNKDVATFGATRFYADDVAGISADVSIEAP